MSYSPAVGDLGMHGLMQFRIVHLMLWFSGLNLTTSELLAVHFGTDTILHRTTAYSMLISLVDLFVDSALHLQLLSVVAKQFVVRLQFCRLLNVSKLSAGYWW